MEMKYNEINQMTGIDVDQRFQQISDELIFKTDKINHESLQKKDIDEKIHKDLIKKFEILKNEIKNLDEMIKDNTKNDESTSDQFNVKIDDISNFI